MPLINPRIQIFINFILLATICGILFAFFGNFIPDRIASMNTMLFGYLLTGFMLIFLYIISWIYVTNVQGDKSIKSKISQIFSSTFPSILILGQVIYIVAINFIYKKRLIENRVADEYYTYSKYFSLLLLLQIALLTKFFIDRGGPVKLDKSSSIEYVISIFGVLSFIFLGIMQVILQYFSTDG